MQAKVFVKTDQMTNEEWLEWRNKGIGGSDISALLGLNRYRSRLSLYLEKTGNMEPEDLSDNEFIYWGNVLEDVVAREFAKRTGNNVRRRFAMLQHPEHDFALANVDRLIIGKREGLECKTAGAFKEKEWSTDEIPDEYFLQCQWYMAVTGYERWHIAVLVGGNKFFHYPVDRDEALVEMLLDEAGRFWNDHVLAGNPPEWDGSDANKDLVNKLYPLATNDERIELPAETYGGKLDRLDEVKEEIKALEEEKKHIENEIKAILQDRECGIIGDRKVTWKNVLTNRFDSKKFKVEHPDLYKRYTRETVGRRINIS